MSTSNHPFLEFPQLTPPFLMMGKTLKWKPNSIEIAPSCPRCFSSNTKFCYYNNYSVSQPRYFCKSCRRYWTKGGSLRNVPIGGGCRKSRRGRSSRRESPPPPLPPAETKNAEVAAAAASSGVKDYDESGNFESVEAAAAAGDEGLRHVHGSFDGGDFGVYENFDMFEVNGVGSEMVWSELEGFGSEQPPPTPLMEMQGFEVFSSDENLITENWSSFDLENF